MPGLTHVAMEPESTPAQDGAAASSPPALSPQQPAPRPARRRTWYQTSAAWFRWVHIYVSMLSFAALFFFAVTGITLNHPTWLGAGEQRFSDTSGSLDPRLVVGEQVDELQVAESLRAAHGLKGRVTEFNSDEFECMVVFKGPGYSADVFVDRETGDYTLTEATTNLVAVLNDLHKGRDSGAAWSWVIDLSAVVMLVMSLSGFGLLFYLKKRRVAGVLTAVVGTLLLVMVWALWVP